MIDEDRVALVFEKPSWTAFQITADSRGIETTDMIASAVVNLLGPAVKAPNRN